MRSIGTKWRQRTRIPYEARSGKDIGIGSYLGEELGEVIAIRASANGLNVGDRVAIGVPPARTALGVKRAELPFPFAREGSASAKAFTDAT